MLSQFMKNDHSMPNYLYMNDRFLYIDYIDKNYEYESVSVLPIEAYRYQGNFYGLLLSVGVSASLLVFTMYLNGYTNPLNYDGVKVTFKVPKRVPIPDY